MRIKLVVLDMAGTTVRDDDAVNATLREALAVAGILATRDEVNDVMGWPKPLAIQALLERFTPGLAPEIGAEAVRQIHDDFLQRMIAHYQTSPTVGSMPHAEDALRSLHAAGVQVALDTGFSRPIVDVILHRLGWQGAPWLATTVASDEVPRGRPHPDLLWRAMEKTDLREAAAVAKVGDTPSDLQEGAAAGCGLIVGVTNGTHVAEQLRPHPHTHLIPSLAELPPLVLAHA